MVKLLTQVCVGITLLAGASMASASVVPMSEPGPFGLLAMGGLALLIATRLNRDK